MSPSYPVCRSVYNGISEIMVRILKRNIGEFTGFEIDESKFERPQPIMIE